MDVVDYAVWMMGEARTAGAGAIIAPAIAMVLGVASAIAAAMALSPGIGRKLAPPPPEPEVVDYLPFVGITSEGDLLLRHGRMCRVWGLDGTDHGGADEVERESWYRAKTSWLDAVAGDTKGIDIRMITIRRETEEDNTTHYDGEVTEAVRKVCDLWKESLTQGIFDNRHYIVVTVRANEAGQRTLDEIERTTRTMLGVYGPQRLKVGAPDVRLEPMEAIVATQTALAPFAAWCSPASRGTPGAQTGADLNRLCAIDEIWFGPRGRMRFSGNNGTRHARIVGIRGLPDGASETLGLQLAQIRGEVTLLHSVRPQDKAWTITELTRRRNVARGAVLQEVGLATAAQIDDTIKLLQGVHESGWEANMFEYQLTIMCYGRTEAALEHCVGQVEGALRIAGFLIVREGIGCEGAFWQAIPTYDTLMRPWSFLTFPIAALWSLQTAPRGNTDHDWGPRELIRFRTAEGGAYCFTWPASPATEAPAHTVVVGATGGGKTMLLSLLTYHTLMIPNAQVFVMDRWNGTETMTHAAGGEYIRFDIGGGDEDAGGRLVSMNPMQMEDTPINRRFVERWIRSLLGNDPLDADDEEAIRRAVRIAYDWAPPQRRSLREVYPAAFADGSRAARELRRWVEPDALGNLFNAERDTLGESDARIITYDCTHVLDDPDLAGPVMSYLSHRINAWSNAHGTPTLIYVDESAPMLRNASFRRTFEIGLQEGRKLRQAWVCCFQRPSVMAEIGMDELIGTQSPSAILMRSPRANEEDYATFRLTRAELDFVCNRSHRNLSRAALLKRYGGGGSTILDTGMDVLGDWMRVFQSGTNATRRCRELIARYGQNEGVARYVREK